MSCQVKAGEAGQATSVKPSLPFSSHPNQDHQGPCSVRSYQVRSGQLGQFMSGQIKAVRVNFIPGQVSQFNLAEFNSVHTRSGSPSRDHQGPRQMDQSNSTGNNEAH